MKTPLLYLTRQRRNQLVLFWWRRICALLLLHLSLTAITFAQNKVWDKTFGGNDYDYLEFVQQTSDGGYILGGYSYSDKSGDKSQNNKGSYDYWVVKLKADGTKVWDKTIGGNDYDFLASVQQTQDGGYILGGGSWSGVGGDKSQASRGENDYWVVKLNASGGKEWDKTFGGSGRDVLRSLQETSDGGYILGGTSDSGISGDKSQARRDIKGKNDEYYNGDYWVVKLKADGSKVWDKTIGGDRYDELTSLQQTSDGGYILGGSSSSDRSGEKSEGLKNNCSEDASFCALDYWVVKLKDNGVKEWDKTIGGDATDNLTSLQQTSDGGYIVGGTSASGKSGDKTQINTGDDDYWVVKLKSNGAKVWDKTFGGNSFDRLTSLQQTQDGGYILGGYSGSSISGDKTEASKGECSDGYCSNDYWVVKLKANGTKLWDKTIGGDGYDALASVRQTSDGGYILGGYSGSGISGNKSQANNSAFEFDFWVVKLNNSGALRHQTITFQPISDKKLGDAPFTLSAQASSGLPVTFSIISGPATIKNNTITLTGLGKVTVKASVAGNTTYQSTEATQTFAVEVPSTVAWNKTFGGDEIDALATMVPTPDGGYLLGGSSISGKSGNKSETNKGTPDAVGNETSDYWLVKTDRTGKKIWDKTFGGSSNDNLTALVATTDGGYLLGGSSTSPVSGDKTQASKGDTDYWVIKINANGTKLWDKAFGGSDTDNLSALVAAPDGGYLLGGTSASGKSGNKSQTGKGETDYWLIKLDATGKKLWDKTYGGSDDDYLAALVATNNGGYLLGGSSASGISGDKSQAARTFTDYWVVRIDEKGTKVWDKTFGGSKDSYYDYFCGDYSEDEEDDCTEDFGDSFLSALVATPDGGFLLGGSSTADKGAEKSENNLVTNASIDAYYFRDYWVVKIDGNGNKVWDNTYGGIDTYYNENAEEYSFGDSELASIVATPDGNFLLAGISDSDKGRDKSENNRQEAADSGSLYDYWVVQIDGNGNKRWDKTIGSFENDYLSAVLAGTGGSYILGGSAYLGIGADKTEEGYGSYDYWLVNLKVDEDPVLSAWDMRYGGAGNEGFTSVIKTADGGYLSGGYSPSGVSGDKTQGSQGKNDYWIVKSDKNGKMQWDKRYGGSQDDYLNRIIQTSDGGYLLAGSSLSGVSGDKSQASRGDRDYWIVKISSTGVKQWDKRFGGSGYDELKKVIQLSTGEYLLAGYSNSPASGDKSQASQGGNDYWLVKISANGAKIWDKRYGGSLNETLSGIVLATEGGFLLGGSSLSGVSGSKSEVSRGESDFWLVRVDKNGNQLWDKTYGGTGQDEAYSLGNAGSNFFISGQSDSPAGGDKTRGSQGVIDFWFLKITSTGAKIWDKRFGGSGADELRASIQTRDGGYLLAGKSFSNKSGNKSQDSQGGSSDYWIVKTDKDGMYQWDKRFGGSRAEELRAVTQTSDGGFLLAGRSESGVSGDRSQPSQGGSDYWLVKIAPETMPLLAAREAAEAEEAVTPVAEVQLQTYPNPFSDKATINFTLPETQPASVTVYDSQGRAVATLFQGEAQANQVYQVEWRAGNEVTGLYILQLQTPTIRQQLKLLLAK